ncbi:group II intron maturase-specific domain-containing protein [Priestia aryabhattai]
MIRGYGQYWKHVVSNRRLAIWTIMFFSKLVKHLKHLHQKKSWKWITKRYFRKPNHGGNDRWTLTCPLTNIQTVEDVLD